MGIFPDIIVTRSDEPIEQGIRDKIALFCNVKPDCVIENLTVPVLYPGARDAGKEPLLGDRLPRAELDGTCPSPT